MRKLLLAVAAIALAGSFFHLASHRPGGIGLLPTAEAAAQPGPPSDPFANCFSAVDRDRAWCLLQNALDGSGQPLWQYWTPVPADGTDSTTSNMCPPPAAHQQQLAFIRTMAPAELRQRQKIELIRALRTPVQFHQPVRRPAPLARGRHLLAHFGLATAPPRNMAAAVLYNDALLETVCAVRGSGSLQAALTSPANSHGLPPLTSGRTQVVIKTMWAIVPKSGDSPTLDVWNNQGPHASINNSQSPVDLDDSEPANFDCKKAVPLAQPGGNSPMPNPQVDLRCFFSLPLSSTDIQALSTSLATNLTPAVGGGTGINAYLVLVGFHIVAKPANAQQWTWQTFWWSAQSTTVEAKYALGSKFSALPAWSNIVMNTSPGSFFNPYLEAQLTNGQVSNCTRCHSHAAYVPISATNTQTVIHQYFEDIQGCAIPEPATVNPKPCPSNPNPAAISTDMLWTLGDSNITSLQHDD